MNPLSLSIPRVWACSTSTSAYLSTMSPGSRSASLFTSLYPLVRGATRRSRMAAAASRFRRTASRGGVSSKLNILPAMEHRLLMVA